MPKPQSLRSWIQPQPPAPKMTPLLRVISLLVGVYSGSPTPGTVGRTHFKVSNTVNLTLLVISSVRRDPRQTQNYPVNTLPSRCVDPDPSAVPFVQGDLQGVWRYLCFKPFMGVSRQITYGSIQATMLVDKHRTMLVRGWNSSDNIIRS